jgi:hypothetical protein
VEEEDEDEGVSSQLTLQALAGNLQRMNSLWGPQEDRLVHIGFWFFYDEGTEKQEESVRYLFSNVGTYTRAAVHNVLDADYNNSFGIRKSEF